MSEHNSDRGFGRLLRQPAKGSIPEVDKSKITKRQEYPNSPVKKAVTVTDRGFGKHLPEKPEVHGQQRSGPPARL